MNPIDTRITAERTRPIGPDVGKMPVNPILAGVKTADMLYDRPVALRNLERAMPNLSSAPRIRSMENPSSAPDLSLRSIPPDAVPKAIRMEVTQNDPANYAVPKRSQIADDATIQNRRMLQDQQLVFGDRVPPQMLIDPKSVTGLVGENNEAYLRVPKRNSMAMNFSELRNTQDVSFYKTRSGAPSDINDVSRRRMVDRNEVVTQTMPRDFDELSRRSDVNYNRSVSGMLQSNDPQLMGGVRGAGVVMRGTRPAEIPVDSRRV